MRDLRNIYIDKPDLEKRGKEFNEKYKKERINKAAYDIIRAKGNSNSWGEFKSDFTLYTENRCPVCEERINQYDDIEHYRPKKDYWWLAYDFYNYYNCCDLCNTTYKKNFFPLFDESKKVDFATKDKISDEQPLLFNPLKDDPLELFYLEFFMSSSDGSFPSVRYIPNINLDRTSYKYAKALKTIELFNLNNENPKNDPARRSTLNDLSIAIKHFRKIVRSWRSEPDLVKRAEQGKIIKEFRDKSGLFLCQFVIKGLYIDLTKSI